MITRAMDRIGSGIVQTLVIYALKRHVDELSLVSNVIDEYCVKVRCYFMLVS
jgi:hypothetical protein